MAEGTVQEKESSEAVKKLLACLFKDPIIDFNR